MLRLVGQGAAFVRLDAASARHVIMNVISKATLRRFALLLQLDSLRSSTFCKQGFHQCLRRALPAFSNDGPSTTVMLEQ